jgi:hypothetical protein
MTGNSNLNLKLVYSGNSLLVGLDLEGNRIFGGLPVRRVNVHGFNY